MRLFVPLIDSSLAARDSHPLEIPDFHGILLFREKQQTSSNQRRPAEQRVLMYGRSTPASGFWLVLPPWDSNRVPARTL